MPLYMIQFAYTSDAWAALAKQPQNRAQGVSDLCRKLGGRLVDLYYCFGEYDGVVLTEMPDDASATSFVIAAAAPGHIRATRTTRLMSIDETVEAMKKAGQVSYAAPSGMPQKA
jgi:uncharacterized protein with GYD domain